MKTSGRRNRFLSVATVTLVLLLSGLLLPHGVGAWPQFLDNLDESSNGFIGKYPTWPYKSGPTGCLTCHMSPPPNAPLNPYGKAFQQAKQGNPTAIAAALGAIAGQDSDGDGVPNEVEILFGAFPGNPASKPVTPGGVKASDAAFEDKVQVAWSAYTNATFHLYRAADSPDGTKAQIASTSNTQFADTTAVAEKTYYYWIKACHGTWCTDFSAPDAGTKKVAAAQPSKPDWSARALSGPIAARGFTQRVAPKLTMGMTSVKVYQNSNPPKTYYKSFDPAKQNAMVEVGYYTLLGGNTKLMVIYKNVGSGNSVPMTAGGTAAGGSRFVSLDPRAVPALAPGKTHELQWDLGLFQQAALTITLNLK